MLLKIMAVKVGQIYYIVHVTRDQVREQNRGERLIPSSILQQTIVQNFFDILDYLRNT